MKKIAGILICIAFAFSFASCSWEIPERVSVKTNASYNFSLGNIPKDPKDQEELMKKLDISNMISSITLPNDGKLYDYWPNKSGDDQRYLMYMPLQEIPVDIGSYFKNGSLADSIKNFSKGFDFEIKVPAVDFSFESEIDLEPVNEEISKNFKLGAFITNYSTSSLSYFVNQFAFPESISYEKGYLKIEAYNIKNNVDGTNLSNAVIDDVIDDLDSNYSGVTVRITSNGEYIEGSFEDGIATIQIPESGFTFKSDNLSITFYKNGDSSYFNNTNPYWLSNLRAFIATIDTSDKTNRPYQIKSVSGITISDFNIPSIEKDIDALSALNKGGVESCTIGKGSLDFDLDLANWTGVSVDYSIALSGGINLPTGIAGKTSTGHLPVSLDSTQITTSETVHVAATCAFALTNATIDFSKNPKIILSSTIEEIEAVTVDISKVKQNTEGDESSEVQLSIDKKQALPSEALAVIDSMALKQCGIKGTYTNELPYANGKNNISLSVFSDFFGIYNITKPNGKIVTIEGGKDGKAFEILSADENSETQEGRVIKLREEPSATATDEYNEFDFKVDVTLPGSTPINPNIITIYNIETNKPYKFAISLEPVIDWSWINIKLSSDMFKPGSVATGFNPTTIFSSLNDVLGEDFMDNISIPDAKLYLYLTTPDSLKELFDPDDEGITGSSIEMYYGDDEKTKITKDAEGNTIENNSISLLESTKTVYFVDEPKFTLLEEDSNAEIPTVISRVIESEASHSIAISQLLKKTEASKVEGAQLCINYNLSLGADATQKIYNNGDLENTSGSVGVFALLEIPLSFKIDANTNIDLKKIMNKNDEENTSDLFGRSDASGFDEIQKYIKVIDSASIYYRLDEFPIKMSDTDGVSINVALGDNSGRGITKTQSLSGGDITITSDEIENLLSAYPLSLKTASIDFAAGNEISIPRKKNINVNLQVGLTTSDESVTLFGN